MMTTAAAVAALRILMTITMRGINKSIELNLHNLMDEKNKGKDAADACLTMIEARSRFGGAR